MELQEFTRSILVKTAEAAEKAEEAEETKVEEVETEEEEKSAGVVGRKIRGKMYGEHKELAVEPHAYEGKSGKKRVALMKVKKYSKKGEQEQEKEKDASALKTLAGLAGSKAKVLKNMAKGGLAGKAARGAAATDAKAVLRKALEAGKERAPAAAVGAGAATLYQALKSKKDDK